MFTKLLTKPLYAHTTVVLLFLVITLAYFSPVFEGKVIHQYDMTNTKGMGKELVDFHEKTGEYSQWTNSMFSGMPAFHVGPYGPSYNMYYFMMQWLRLGLPDADMAILLTLLLAFYILLLTMRFNPWLAFIGAVGFAFSSYNFIIIEVGHITKAYAIAYIPLVVAGTLAAFRRSYLLAGILTTLGLGMELAINHLQITYYLAIMLMFTIAAYFIHSIFEKKIKEFFIASAVLLLSAILATLPNISHLVTTQAITKASIRGKTDLTPKPGENATGLDQEYAMAWSYGKAETFTILVPNFVGGSSNSELSEGSDTYKILKQNGVPNAKEIIKQLPTYHGAMPFTSGPNYFGAIIVFLFLFAVFLVKGPEKWWLLAITVFSIFLAWGKNFPSFNDFIFNNFPFYNKFRVVSMNLVITGFAVPLLAMMGLKELFENGIDKAKMMKYLKIALFSVSGLLLLMVLMPGMFGDFSSAEDARLPEWLIGPLMSDRESMLRMDALRSLVFILLAGGAIWIWIKGKIKEHYLLAALGVLVLVDLWGVNKRYLNNDDYMPKRKIQENILPTQADLQILQDTTPNYRVLNVTVNPFAESRTSYFHKSIGGYHAAKLRRYQELYDRQISKNNMFVLNMLNTKYFIVPGPNKEPMAQMNPYAMGNCWFVEEIKWTNNADEEIAALDSFIPAKTAIIDRIFEAGLKDVKPIKDSLSFIKLVSYQPNKLVYQSNSSHQQLAVFSEIFYPEGWNAYLDGALVPHYRANYVLRTMPVPAGKHEIVFKYEPQFFYTAQTISLWGTIISSIGIAFALVMLYLKIRKKKLIA